MRRFVIPLLILAVLGSAYAVLLGTSQPQGIRQVVSTDAEKHIFAAAFPDLAGQRQPLAQWRGKVVVLNFWATWCPPCRQEIPGFVKMQEQYGDRGLIFIGLALDEKDKVQAFVRENAVNYPILLGDDSAYELAGAIGNQQGGLPFSAVLDRSGKIVAAKVGGLSEKDLERLVAPLL